MGGHEEERLASTLVSKDVLASPDAPNYRSTEKAAIHDDPGQVTWKVTIVRIGIFCTIR